MRLELRTREDIHACCDDDPAPFAVLHPVGVPALTGETPLADLHPEDAFLSAWRSLLVWRVLRECRGSQRS